ncbi:MAG: dihydroorotate dehydrogenase electron transfer subunit [Desulfobacterales bacterium]
MKQETVTVLGNEHLGNGYFRIGLDCSQAYRIAGPGQFVMVHLMDSDAPLLRRPFSIHRQIIDHDRLGGIELLYKVVGNCTEKISRLERGDRLDLLGPLGSGFRISKAHSRIHLVSGGIGVAPMAFLAMSLLEAGIESSACKVFLGGRTQDDVLCREIFSDLGMVLSISTDDGSAGNAGLVTDPLEVAVKAEKPDMIYACGPMGMLGSVADIAESFSVSCQVSVETVMACGMGACLGCAVERRGGQDAFLHACVDGPVFDAALLEY